MTIAAFEAFAKEQLKNVYDQREINSVIRLVMEEQISIPRHHLIFHSQDKLDKKTFDRLMNAVMRLARHEPVQYVLGFADFCGMRIKVNARVLIPRPETEELTDYAVRVLLPIAKTRTISVLDIGTGSGCIAIAMKKKIPMCKVTAIDSSEDAMAVARANAARLHCDVNFITMDFLDERNWKSLELFDAVVSNPPYVTKEEFSELMPRVKKFEPRAALMAEGDDPFIFYRKIAEFGKAHLKTGGQMFLELNSLHAFLLAAIFTADSFKASIINDMQGAARILAIAAP